MSSSAAETPDGLTEHFVGLPVIRIPVVPEILPILHFGLFLIISAPQMQRFGFIWKRESYVICVNSTFHILVPTRGYFFAIIRHTESYLSAYPSSV